MTEGDLQALSELLLQLDSDNVGTAITLDLGGITTTGQTQVSPGQTLVSTGLTQVSPGLTQVSTGQTQVSTGQTQVSTGHTLVSTGQNQVSTGQKKVSTGQPQVSTSYTQVSTGQTYVEVFNFYFFYRRALISTWFDKFVNLQDVSPNPLFTSVEEYVKDLEVYRY